jgi:hypothetical protein
VDLEDFIYKQTLALSSYWNFQYQQQVVQQEENLAMGVLLVHCLTCNA